MARTASRRDDVVALSLLYIRMRRSLVMCTRARTCARSADLQLIRNTYTYMLGPINRLFGARTYTALAARACVAIDSFS